MVQKISTPFPSDARISSRLRATIEPTTVRCAQLFAVLGADAEGHLVGGALRDAALGVQPLDIDVAVRLEPSIVQERLAQAGIRTYATGLRHGTVTALLEDDSPVEITTFRLPNPDNAPLFSESIEIDLSGRDFTINALALNPLTGEIVDPFNGLDDLRAEIVRAVGDPFERFSEDPLRILRMVRFGPASGRAIDEATEHAARSLVDRIAAVSVERLREEVIHILCSQHPRAGFFALRNLEALPLLIPELMPSIGCDQNRWHIEDVFNHTLSVVERTSASDRIVRLTALFHDTGKPATLSIDEEGNRHFYGHEVVSAKLCEEALQRWRCSTDEVRTVTLLVRNHMRSIDCGAPGVRRLLRDLEDQFDRFRAFQDADKTPTISKEDHLLRVGKFDALVAAERKRLEGRPVDKLAVNGHDIMGLGISAGPHVGAVLQQLAEMVIEDPAINVREMLLERARELVAPKSQC
jgi:tRNA nucleotidyltransferase/poly(A) polymerase